MSIATGNMSLQCSKCGNVHNIPSTDADFENSYGGERQMGPESGHTWQHTIECKCGSEIEIDYEVWEYPEGIFDNDNVNVNGGKLIDKFGYDFHGQPDPDEQ